MPYIGAGIQRFNTADSLTVNGDAEVTGTVNPSGDTASGDAAAVGFTSTEGLILTGQGSTSDITLKNDADAVVFSVPTGTDDILFPDNAKAIFGAGSDLELSHNGTNSIIEGKTGDLILRTAGTESIFLQDAGGNNLAQFNDNSDAKLYHNANEKLATTSSGVDITGGFTATDGCTITTADNDAQLTLKSTDADSTTGPELDLVRDSASPADGDGIGRIKFTADNDAGEATTYSTFFTTLRDASDGSEDGQVIHYAIRAGTLVDHLRIGRGSAGGQSEVVINEGSADIDFRVESNGNANMLFVDGGNDLVLIGTSSFTSGGGGIKFGGVGDRDLSANGTGAIQQLGFHNPNGEVGSIFTNGSATTFSTSSDYRIKENVVALSGAISRVKQLAPKRFNFIADADTTLDGFLAHEAQVVVPEAVIGTHNEVDDDGNAVMQGIDQSKLVPLLTGALQEAIAKIEALETEMTALKARVTALEDA